ncbi:acyl-CoA thioesterase [Thaumasiovibrio subtropicus]|uniref:acyl-CoA thioesterase n=1 Tax=Thaumasiovibrio subtropicus TaxID=1891207 RepID=UPI000B3626B5|nr:acyl-CoA thioesterase [Thaumasiovibrio subtropicus]
MPRKQLRAEISMVTAFQDADPMGIVYHGNYFRFFEEARRVLLEQIDYGYRAMSASGYSWPVIDTQVKYVKAIPFNHPICITATLSEWEHRLRVKYLITSEDKLTVYTRAHTTQVAVNLETETMCLASPSCFTDRITSAIRLNDNDVEQRTDLPISEN